MRNTSLTSPQLNPFPQRSSPVLTSRAVAPAPGANAIAPSQSRNLKSLPSHRNSHPAAHIAQPLPDTSPANSTRLSEPIRSSQPASDPRPGTYPRSAAKTQRRHPSHHSAARADAPYADGGGRSYERRQTGTHSPPPSTDQKPDLHALETGKLPA